jgi:DegV family protein with EDD domain
LSPQPTVAIVTDSASSIPRDLRDRYNIQVIPFWVQMGAETYRSGIDLDEKTFFQRLRADPDLSVSTAVPPLSHFIEIYERVSEWAQGVVAIHIAGKQSGTCSAAERAGRESPIPVAVIDSGSTGMAEGFVVLEAARAAAEGASMQAVVDHARSVVPNVNLIALLESVTFALKGGRLSSAAGRVGSFLRIQPLIQVKENKVGLNGQVRRHSHGLRTLVDKVASDVGDDPVHLTVHFAEDEEEGSRLLETLKERVQCVESYLARVPVALGVHAGPGSIGVAYYVEREGGGLVEQLERLGSQARDAIRSRLPNLPGRES